MFGKGSGSMVRQFSLLSLLCASVFVTRCEGKKETVASAPAPATSMPTVGGAAVNPVAQAGSSGTNLDYIGAEFAAGFVARPKQLIQSKFGQALIASAFEGDDYKDTVQGFNDSFGIELEDVSQIAVLMREANFAANMGIKLPQKGEGAAAVNERELKNNLKNVALAMHNYHDVYSRFPNASMPNLRKPQAKLSWRVAILPFIEEVELYEKFNLNEPWDSDHNKALISEMPALYKTPGTGPNKTSMHVVTGDGGPFSVEKLQFRDVTDGASSTIMAAIAGADAAVEWTKPGGLELDTDDPWGTFGSIEAQRIVTMFDGSAGAINRTTDQGKLLAMLTHQSGEVIESIDDLGLTGSAEATYGPKPDPLPTLIIHTSVPVNKEKAVESLGESFAASRKKTVKGHEYFDWGGYAIWFPTATSIVATQTDSLPEMMSNKSGSGTLRDMFRKNSGADFVGCADATSMPTVKDKLMAQLPPVFGMAKQLVSANLVVDVSAANQPMARIVLSTSDENSAGAIKGVLGGFLAMGQQQVGAAPVPPEMDSVRDTFAGMIEGVEIEQDGKNLTYHIAKPAKYDQFVDNMKPQFKQLGIAVRQARAAARRTVKKNNLKQIGLAFFDHHDVYRSFGTADGSDGRRKGGLSWRVHLLPFMDQGPLYKKFRIDEPWDSEHNKALISQMPEIYKVDGVTDEGKTSIHVLTGEAAPFKDGKTKFGIDDVIDGTPFTILAVSAGPNKAEIWTKPGGLEVNTADPIATFGNIIGDTFMTLFADGSADSIPKTIDKDVLNALMTHAGREVIDLDDIR